MFTCWRSVLPDLFILFVHFAEFNFTPLIIIMAKSFLLNKLYFKFTFICAYSYNKINISQPERNYYLFFLTRMKKKIIKDVKLELSHRGA